MKEPSKPPLNERIPLSRRQMLLLSAASGLSAAGLAGALDQDGESGNLWGGTMALSQAFNVAGDLWIGPDSAKADVDKDSGQVYWATDTGGVFYSDGGSWVKFDGDLQSLTTEVLSNDDYHENVVTGDITGTTGLDLSAANFFRHTLTGNVTFEFNNPNADPAGNSFTLIVVQDGTGGHAITWPGSVEWDSGTAPSLSTSANDKHMLGFVSPDGGTTWIGVVSAEAIA